MHFRRKTPWAQVWWSILLLILLDHSTKYFLKRVAPFTLIKGVHIVHVWNRGISFGLLSHYKNTTLTIGLGIFALIVSIYILSLYRAEEDCLQKISGILIAAGGISNAIERIIYRSVFDFLEIKVWSYSFPAFNLADAFISLGCTYMLYWYVFKKEKVAF